MKNLILSILFAATAIVSSQSFAQSANIDFKKEVHDYGSIANGSNGTCTFEFTNTGNAPLIVTKVNNPCGCISVEWPTEDIAPGKTGTIKLTYDTKRVGTINKSVTVSSNAANEPVKVLRIKGTVRPVQ